MFRAMLSDMLRDLGVKNVVEKPNGKSAMEYLQGPEKPDLVCLDLTLPDVSGYGTVILASPIWNVRPPMIMSTFLDGVSLAGTTILPVTTHAMSGLGRAPEVYATLAPDAVVGEGLAVRGERVADAGPEIDRWVRAAGIG